MIIVEGPDGAGKSTLISKMCQQWKELHLVDWGVPREEIPNLNLKQRALRAISNTISPMYAHRERPDLYDRLYWSELVYGPIVRGECKYTLEDQHLIEGLFETLGVPTILCLPPLDVVRVNTQDPTRDQMGGVRENITAIYEGYERLFKNNPDFFCIYDYTNPRTWANVEHAVKRAFTLTKELNPH